MHAFVKPGVILLLGVLASFLTYAFFTQAHQADARARISVLAQSIDVAELEALSGTAADQGTPGYAKLKAYLRSVRENDPSLRFVYILGKNADGQLFFYADSEPASSPDVSPPGQIYYEATPEMFSVIEEGLVVTEGPDRDRWGVWMSAHAPVGTPPSALIGMDIPAGKYYEQALLYALIPFFFSLIVLMYLLWRRAMS